MPVTGYVWLAKLALNYCPTKGCTSLKKCCGSDTPDPRYKCIIQTTEINVYIDNLSTSLKKS